VIHHIFAMTVVKIHIRLKLWFGKLPKGSEAKNEALRGVKIFLLFSLSFWFFTLRRFCFRFLNSLTIIQNQTENKRRSTLWENWGIYFEKKIYLFWEKIHTYVYGLMPGRLFTSRPEENEDYYWTKTDMIGAAVIGVVFVLSGLIFISYRMGFIRCPCWWVVLVSVPLVTHMYQILSFISDRMKSRCHFRDVRGWRKSPTSN